MSYLLGDRGYFRNPDVNPKTPEWQGENVIVLPDSLYYGHGIGIADADDMIKALNSNRIAGAERSAYLLDMAGRPDYRQLASLYSDMASQPRPWRAFARCGAGINRQLSKETI